MAGAVTSGGMNSVACQKSVPDGAFTNKRMPLFSSSWVCSLPLLAAPKWSYKGAASVPWSHSLRRHLRELEQLLSLLAALRPSWLL